MNRAVLFSSILQSIYSNHLCAIKFKQYEAQWWIIMVMWLDIKLMATAYSDLIHDYLIGEIEHRVVLFSSVRCFY